VKVIRVFPRRTNATPVDADVRVGEPPGLFDKADEIHISVAFTWDMEIAERLAFQWERVAPVKIGGPATGMRGEEFVAGRYLANGYTITSRGCPNRCLHCSVPTREGGLRELPIVDGFNVLDDNLIACSRGHIEAVFSMLDRQKRRPEFTGGLEARRLEPWHAKAMRELRTKQVFFAYDTDGALKPLIEAGRIMQEAGFTTASHSLRCFVLCGFDGDTLDSAERRLRNAIDAGFIPQAMIYHGDKGKVKFDPPKWASSWSRPAKIAGRINAETRVDSEQPDAVLEPIPAPQKKAHGIPK